MNSEFQIAMVNDDRNIQSSLRFALEAEGYVVRTYLDAALGFEGLINEPADLGIFSRDMPYMHGPDLLRRLRQSSNMPAMLLTSFEADDIYRMYGDEVLFDDIITMPFSMHLVVSRVGTILRRGGVGDENSMSTILERGLLQFRFFLQWRRVQGRKRLELLLKSILANSRWGSLSGLSGEVNPYGCFVAVRQHSILWIQW